MKKFYESPSAEIEIFRLGATIVTLSGDGSIEENGDEVDFLEF